MPEHRTVPGMKIDVPFDYEPQAPFGFTMIPPAVYVDDFATLEEAVDRFARDAMPRDFAIRGASVFDAHGVIVVGYLNRHPADRERWYGVRRGFDELALRPYLDPLEVTCAEISAQQHSLP